MIDKVHILLGDSTIRGLLPHFYLCFSSISSYFFCFVEQATSIRLSLGISYAK